MESLWSINKDAKELMHYMKMLIDPRCERKKKHDFAEILTYMVIGTLAGRNSIRRCLNWCRNHMDFLKKHMRLENGIASVSTVSRLLSSIDEEMFCFAFVDWMAGILHTQGIEIAIDGKALRGSMQKIRNQQAPYILNAVAVATKLVIAQIPIGEKENEIAAIPKLLELLNLEECMITIDAIGTVNSVMEKILEKNSDYLLSVKKNNPLTYEETEKLFQGLKEEKGQNKSGDQIYEKQLQSYDVHKTQEKNRSRMEYRTMEVCHDTELITLCEKRKEIKTVGWLEQIRIKMEKDKEGNDITPNLEDFLKKGTVRKPKVTAGDQLTDDIHRVGIISSRKLSAKEALEIKRKHWAVENSLHYVLDTVFMEDRSNAKRSKNNLAIIRKFAYNILQIAILQERKEPGITTMRDLFTDDLTLIEKYVFQGIGRLG